MTPGVRLFDTGVVRYGQPECEHGTPGGGPDTCALCRLVATMRADLDELVDVRMLAAGDR